MKIALATYEGIPELTEDEQALIPLFSRVGIEANAAVWSDKTIEWKNFDAVIIRSCWDYHKRIDEFTVWLNHLDRLGINCWNPSDLIRTNSRKTYLRDLEKQGVNIIPTEWLTNEDIQAIPNIMDAKGWKKAVIKPIVSATAYKTFVIDLAHIDSHLQNIHEAFPDGEVFMLQQFLPQISELGEWSLMFFNKSYSHAALKIPKAGDFRVQTDFGGHQSLQQAPEKLVAQAKEVLKKYDYPILYARVDGLWIEILFI